MPDKESKDDELTKEVELKDNELIEEALVTFRIKAIVRKGIDMKELLTKHTDFLAEPTSVHGCVTEMKPIIIDMVKK